jgi:serine/threonine protein kinase
LDAAGGCLADVFSSKPAWWTPTAKAEAVVGIALALRFAHGFGLLHGGMKANNVLFDGGGRIQIADFHPMRRDGGFSWEGWSPRSDVSAFVMLLFEIVTGRPWPSPPPPRPPSAPKAEADDGVILPPDVPAFVSEIIEGGLRESSEEELSFIAIFEILKKNDFRIVAGVDSDEVSAFISRVESAAQFGESE